MRVNRNMSLQTQDKIELFLKKISNFLPMGVLITEIVLNIFSKYSQRDKRFVNNFSENEYIKTPISES